MPVRIRGRDKYPTALKRLIYRDLLPAPSLHHGVLYGVKPEIPHLMRVSRNIVNPVRQQTLTYPLF